jgi:hypothetical protein
LVCAAMLCGGLGIRFLGLAEGITAQIALGLCAFLLAYGICVPAVLRLKQDA